MMRRNLESLYAITSAVLICWFWFFLFIHWLKTLN